MAGDWIKIEHALPHKPEVMRLAVLLNIDTHQVVGHLVRFWSWCDANLSRECPAVTGTKSGLDGVSGRDGFVDAMVQVGWLDMSSDGTITIPNYDSHLSHSAKQRGLDAKKKARNRKAVPKMSLVLSPECPDANGTFSGPEKRREEKILNNPPAHQFNDLLEVNSQLQEAGGRAGGEGFVETWAAVGTKLSACGVSTWRQTLKEAKEAGCTADLAMRLIDYGIERGYGPGALVVRLVKANPALAIDAGWPAEPPEAVKARERLAGMNAKREAELRESLATSIIRDGRRAKKTDEQITEELRAKGLEWPK